MRMVKFSRKKSRDEQVKKEKHLTWWSSSVQKQVSYYKNIMLFCCMCVWCMIWNMDDDDMALQHIYCQLNQKGEKIGWLGMWTAL